MCGTVCMGAAGPPNLVWGGTGRVGLLITELQYTDSAQIVVRFVVSLPHHRQKKGKANNKQQAVKKVAVKTRAVDSLAK